jgi:hypothetical protein
MNPHDVDSFEALDWGLWRRKIRLVSKTALFVVPAITLSGYLASVVLTVKPSQSRQKYIFIQQEKTDHPYYEYAGPWIVGLE